MEGQQPSLELKRKAGVARWTRLSTPAEATAAVHFYFQHRSASLCPESVWRGNFADSEMCTHSPHRRVVVHVVSAHGVKDVALGGRGDASVRIPVDDRLPALERELFVPKSNSWVEWRVEPVA